MYIYILCLSQFLILAISDLNKQYILYIYIYIYIVSYTIPYNHSFKIITLSGITKTTWMATEKSSDNVGITINMPKNDIIRNEILNGDVNTDEQVLICSERLQKLELLEKQLPEMIEAAIQEHKKNKLRMLHEKDKENPAAVNLRVKRYNERHKEEINARRRAKRKLEKELKEKQNFIINTGTVLESFTANKVSLHKSLSNKIPNKNSTLSSQNSELTGHENSNHTPPSSPTLNDVLTVRFDI